MMIMLIRCTDYYHHLDCTLPGKIHLHNWFSTGFTSNRSGCPPWWLFLPSSSFFVQIQMMISRVVWWTCCKWSVSPVCKKLRCCQNIQLCRWYCMIVCYMTWYDIIWHHMIHHIVWCDIFQNDSHALLIAERGVDYHRLDYEAKVDYWEEVEIVMTIVINYHNNCR